MLQRVVIELEGTRGPAGREVFDSLEREPAAVAAGIEFELSEARSIEAAIIVAIIGGGATVLAALIQAVGNIALARGARTIKVKGKYGGDMEVPVGASPEEIDAVVARMQRLESPSLIIR